MSDYDNDDRGDDNHSFDDYNNYDENIDDEVEEANEEEDEIPDEGIDVIMDGNNLHSKNQKPNQERITTKYLTKFEKARVLGARAVQISRNAPILVTIDKGLWDPLKIAEKELQENKIPFIIRRYLPDKSYEDWRVDELLLD